MTKWAILLGAMALAAACGGSGAPRAGASGDDGGQAGVDAANPVDAGGGADGGASDGASDAAGDSAGPSCAPTSLAGIQVATVTGANNPLDPLGYPPYALDGCTLVYVAPAAPGQTSGELRRRDLSTGNETPLAPASEQPRRPAIAGDLIAWEAVVAGASIVRVSKAGQTTTVTGPFVQAGEPRVTGDAVVFTAWLTSDSAGDTDVYLYLPASTQLVAVATGPGQQRFADVSASYVAVSDFSEDPTGAFSPDTLRLADVAVFDRMTLARTLRHLPGKQAFPMLGSGTHLGYLDWNLVNPEPKFSAYGVMVGTVTSDPTTDGNVKGTGQVQVNTPYVRPSVRADWIEWVDESTGGGGLFRRPLDLSQAFTSTLGGVQLLGPVAGQPMTIVLASSAGGYALTGVTH